MTLSESLGFPPEIADEILGYARFRARRVDRGDASPAEALRWLGERRLLDLGADGHGELADQAAVVATLARGCMSTSFSTWAHRMGFEYVVRFGTQALRADVVDPLRQGTIAGSTAMATALRDRLGFGELSLTLHATEDGWRLDGTIPWASNLFRSGFLVVVPARDDAGRGLAVAVRSSAEGLTTRHAPQLLALNATESGSIGFDSVVVSDHDVLDVELDRFLDGVRPTFLLLQSALCVGLVEAALESSATRLQGIAASLRDEQEQLEERHRAAVGALAAQLRDPSADVAVVETRRSVARLAVDAVHLEARASGGSGYAHASATARRLREAAFLPVQSPTDAELAWELAR